MAFSRQQIQALQQMFNRQAREDDGLISFKAGRMYMDETTRIVTADTKRGKVKLTREQDGTLHFKWSNRINGEQGLDIMLFAGTAEWNHCPDCTDGRVYVLRMKDTNMRHFFWMQDASDEKDEEIATKINKLCNGQSIDGASSSASGGGGGGGGGGQAPVNPYARLFQQMGASAPGAGAGAGGGNRAAPSNPYAALFQQAAGAGAGGAGAGAGGGGGGSGAEAMQRMLLQSMGLLPGGAGAGGGGAAAGGGGMSREQLQAALRERQQRIEAMADLEDVLSPEAVLDVLDDEKVCEELLSRLPEGATREDVATHMQSPQFVSALRRLQAVINGDQMAVIVQQMGLPEPAREQLPGGPAVPPAGVEPFLEHLVAHQSGADSGAAAAAAGDQPKDEAAEDKPKE